MDILDFVGNSLDLIDYEIDLFIGGLCSFVYLGDIGCDVGVVVCDFWGVLGNFVGDCVLFFDCGSDVGNLVLDLFYGVVDCVYGVGVCIGIGLYCVELGVDLFCGLICLGC